MLHICMMVFVKHACNNSEKKRKKKYEFFDVLQQGTGGVNIAEVLSA